MGISRLSNSDSSSNHGHWYKRQTRLALSLLIVAGILISAGCMIRRPPPPPPPPLPPTATMTVTPIPTATKPATSTSTATAVPSATTTATAVPSTTATAVATVTATRHPATSTPRATEKAPAALLVQAAQDAIDIHSGPGKAFDVIGRLLRGEEAEILGRDVAGDWINIRTAANLVGWVAAEGVEVMGGSPADILLAGTIPAPPTAPATPGSSDNGPAPTAEATASPEASPEPPSATPEPRPSDTPEPEPPTNTPPPEQTPTSEPYP